MGRLRRKVSSLVVVGVMSGLALLVLVPANAAQVPPVEVSGNPDCTSIGSSAAFSTKFEPISANLSVSRTVNGVTIDMTIDSTGRFMSFSVTNGHADDVIVKGGPNANWYAYGENGTEGDSGLQAPSRGTSSFAISHVEFCFDVPPPTFTISGVKFHDHNANGTLDAGDGGLSGWTISAGSQSDTTDSDGSYSISGLLAGTYNVCETPQEDWLASSPTTGCQEVTVGPDATNVNFGNYQNGAISGSKTDGVVGLEGWTIFIDANGNGNLDTGEQSIATVSDGSYTLGGLKPGSYDVCEVLQAGYDFTVPDDGCHDSADAEAVTVTSGLTTTGVDFSNHQVFGISGSKYNDLNASGTANDLEPKISGWAIHLFNGEGLVDSTVTDVNGDYSFDGVLEGSYVVCEAADGPGEENWQQSGPLNSLCSGSEGMAPGGHSVILPPGEGDPAVFDFFNFDGEELNCVTPATVTDGTIIGEFQLLENPDNGQCPEDKSALLAIDSDTGIVTFIPVGSSVAFFEGTLTFTKASTANDALILQYDRLDSGVFVEVPDCEFEGEVAQFPVSSPDWCVESATATKNVGSEVSNWTIVWNVLGKGDPKFR